MVSVQMINTLRISALRTYQYNIRRSIELGLDPVKAYKMASTNTALCYHLKDLGAIAPSYKANLVVLDDANSVAIHEVFYKGNLLNEF